MSVYLRRYTNTHLKDNKQTLARQTDYAKMLHLPIVTNKKREKGANKTKSKTKKIERQGYGNDRWKKVT